MALLLRLSSLWLKRENSQPLKVLLIKGHGGGLCLPIPPYSTSGIAELTKGL